MKKFLATLVAAIALAFGGVAVSSVADTNPPAVEAYCSTGMWKYQDWDSNGPYATIIPLSGDCYTYYKASITCVKPGSSKTVTTAWRTEQTAKASCGIGWSYASWWANASQ